MCHGGRSARGGITFEIILMRDGTHESTLRIKFSKPLVGAPLPQQRVATSDGTNLDSTRTDDMGESTTNVRIEVRAVDTLSPNSQWRTLVPIAQARQCVILESPATGRLFPRDPSRKY